MSPSASDILLFQVSFTDILHAISKTLRNKGNRL